MTPENIKDRDSLLAWFDEQPAGTIEEHTRVRNLALLLAHRAAMRVLPIALRPRDVSEERELKKLPFFWASLASGCAAVSVNPAIVDASAGAARAAADGFYKVASSPAGDLTIAAHSAADAASSTTILEALHAAAVSPSATNGDIYHAAWVAIRNDCIALSEGLTFDARPLWPDANPLSEIWRESQERLREVGSHWEFWIDWYENVLKGEPQDWSGLLTEIALIPPADWDKGPDHISTLIEDLRLKYAIKATPNAEIISLNPETGKFRADPITELPRDILPECVEKLQNVLALFDLSTDRANQFRPIEQEITLISQAVNHYATRPRMLHSNCARVLRRLDIKIANGDCPSQSQDPDIADFHATILGVSIDLLQDPLVQEAVTHTAATRLKDLAPAESATLIEAADAIAEASEGPLATELPTDARAATDLNISDPDRKEALYITASRLLRVWLITGYKGGKKGLEEIASVTKLSLALPPTRRRSRASAPR